MMYISSRHIQHTRSWSKYWQDQIVLAFAVTLTRDPPPSFQSHPIHLVPTLYVDNEITNPSRM